MRKKGEERDSAGKTEGVERETKRKQRRELTKCIGDTRPIVLLGEDEQFQARLVKSVLERKNFIVQVADDGIMAYSIHHKRTMEILFWVILDMYIKSHSSYSLVMMDIFLPKMDGLTSIKLIRKFEAENKSKRIYL